MNLVEVKDFSFSYPECSHKVLEHVNLKIKEGTLNVICGRSGCGKSTLLRQLKTVLAPAGNTSGQILYRGVSLKDTDHRTQSQEIGFVMQNPDNQIVTDKVWHELAFGLESLGYDNATIRLRVAELSLIHICFLDKAFWNRRRRLSCILIHLGFRIFRKPSLSPRTAKSLSPMSADRISDTETSSTGWIWSMTVSIPRETS